MAVGCINVVPTTENQTPIAHIDSITPDTASPGEAVSFVGHGTDTDGTVVAYRWRSNLDDALSTTANFESSSLSSGTHIIYFKVQDNNGTWSTEVRKDLTISDSVVNAPAINSFNANPGSISSGGTATLNWNITNATIVSIDQGIGDVASTGSRTVSPVTTTTYTLTATNSAGSVNANTQIIVSGSPPSGIPVINSFSASPDAISAGDSTTLTWDITGATNVTIDPGVGSVALSGSTTVSPATSINYTLTAANSSGWRSMTITVIVSGSVADTTPPTVPILVSPANGGTLPQPEWAFNWNDSEDPESGILKYQIYVIKQGASIPVVDEEVTPSNYSKTLGGYISSSNLNNWTWKVRAQNNEGIWSDWSPVRIFNVEQNVAYDFIEEAATATWWNSGGETLPFPGANNDNRGFSRYETNISLNDGGVYSKVLETHPRWVDNGWISGKYYGISIPSGAKLVVKLGYIQGGAAGNVRFKAGKAGSVPVLDIVRSYAGGIYTAEIDLGAYAGQTIDFVLNVNANGTSTQDWAVWAVAKIVN